MTRLSFSLSLDTSGEKSLSPESEREHVDVLLRVAQVERVDDHADVGAVLAAHLALRDVDQLDAVAVEVAHDVAVVAPVAVGALVDDAALLEQALRAPGRRETGGLHVAHAEREVLEVDEDGDQWFF